MLKTVFRGAAALAVLAIAPAYADVVNFTIANNLGAGNMWLMRPWVGISDGNYTTFTVGSVALAPVMHEAEDGVTGSGATGSGIFGPGNSCTGTANSYPAGTTCLYQDFGSYSNAFSQTSIGGPSAPGASLTGTLGADPNDPNSQYLQFLVMAIPSNDTFFGTASGQGNAVQLFTNGLFNNGNGDIVINITAGQLLDAGTEDNNGCSGPADGVAFLCQGPAGQGTKTSGGVITQFTSFDSSLLGLTNGFGGNTNSFANLNSIFSNRETVIATITISDTPEPASFALFGLTAGALAAFQALRRRRA